MKRACIVAVVSIIFTTTLVFESWFTSELSGQNRRPSSRAAAAAKKKAVASIQEEFQELLTAAKAGKTDQVGDAFVQTDPLADGSLAKTLASSKTELARFVKVITLFDDAAVHLSENRNEAVMVTELPKNTDDLQPPKSDKPAVANAAVNNDGLGNDLKKALQDALALLEAGKTEAFVDNMMPDSERKRLSVGEKKKELITRIEKYPMVSQFMRMDLKQLATLTPKIENDGTVAVFKLPGNKNLGDALRNNYSKMPDPPTRTIKFELQNGHWRFFDSGKLVNAEIERQEFGMPSGGALKLRWQKTATGWKVDRLPFFKVN